MSFNMMYFDNVRDMVSGSRFDELLKFIKNNPVIGDDMVGRRILLSYLSELHNDNIYRFFKTLFEENDDCLPLEMLFRKYALVKKIGQECCKPGCRLCSKRVIELLEPIVMKDRNADIIFCDLHYKRDFDAIIQLVSLVENIKNSPCFQGFIQVYILYEDKGRAEDFYRELFKIISPNDFEKEYLENFRIGASRHMPFLFDLLNCETP